MTSTITDSNRIINHAIARGLKIDEPWVIVLGIAFVLLVLVLVAIGVRRRRRSVDAMANDLVWPPLAEGPLRRPASSGMDEPFFDLIP